MSKISKKDLKKFLKKLDKDAKTLPKTKKPMDPSNVYQLRIDLDGCKPPVWRRIEVGSHLNFAELHQIIQTLFDWQDRHVYQFTIGDEELVGPDIAYGVSTLQENKQKRASEEYLGSQFKQVKQFKYTYGLKNPRKCTIKIEKVESVKNAPKSAETPCCVKIVKEVPQEFADEQTSAVPLTETQINQKLANLSI